MLLFDEYYTDLYRMSEAEERMWYADHIVFMGTSFSVNITNIALQIARQRGIEVSVVDPDPIQLPYDKVHYYKMKASAFIQQ